MRRNNRKKKSVSILDALDSQCYGVASDTLPQFDSESLEGVKIESGSVRRHLRYDVKQVVHSASYRPVERSSPMPLVGIKGFHSPSRLFISPVITANRMRFSCVEKSRFWRCGTLQIDIFSNVRLFELKV